MFSKKIHASFHHFIDQCNDFNDHEKINIHGIFEKNIIKNIFNFTVILTIWAFLASWIDVILFSGATIFSLKNMEVSSSLFISFIIFILLNASLKFLFMFLFTRKMKFIKIYHLFFAVTPYIGSIYIIGTILSHEKLFFSALKKYLRSMKKKENFIKIFRNKNQKL